MEKAKRMERIKGRLKFWFLTCERKTIFWLGTLSFAIIASFISLLVANSFLSKTPETYEVGEITNFVKKSHANGEDIELPSGAFVNFRDEQSIKYKLLEKRKRMVNTILTLILPIYLHQSKCLL